MFPLLIKRLRVLDAFGSGVFKAARSGGRTHNGIDYLAEKNETVYAPINGTFKKYGYAYANDFNLRYVEIENKNLRFRLFYVNKVQSLTVGSVVKKGEVIGTVANVAARYNTTTKKMDNHIHVEVYKDDVLQNPEEYLEETDVIGGFFSTLLKIPKWLIFVTPFVILLAYFLLRK